jgi:hypothetical protein
MEIARERQAQRDLHQLGRLQLEELEVDPALRAHADLAHEFDIDQQDEGDPIERIGDLGQALQIDHADHQHDADADCVAHHLPVHPRLRAAAGG